MNRLNRLSYVMVMLLAASLFLALIWLPKLQVAELRKQLPRTPVAPAGSNPVSPLDVFNAEDKARQTLAAIIGGLLVFVGSYLTWRNVRATEEKQITDRFTSAVNNLSADGNDKMAQRLGGIYALERITRDSQTDYWTVIEVLTAYVRDKRPISFEETRQSAIGSYSEEGQIVRSAMPKDIQAVLTVIGRRDANRDKSGVLDLQDVDLYRANLFGANLKRANLKGADLERGDLRSTDLRGADLEGADLRGARLENAKLTDTGPSEAELMKYDRHGINPTTLSWSSAKSPLKTNLGGANLAHVDLSGVNLNGTNLWGVNLEGADLSRANLGDAILRGANLIGATLEAADLCEANLMRTRLIKADISEADLRGAILLHAKLMNAKLRGANLSRATLVRADLTQVNLVNADLTEADLTGASVKEANFDGAILAGANLGECRHLTQKQLDSADQVGMPLSLPPELHFPA